MARHKCFQVRLKLMQVDGISVFKDFGHRNDVFVRGTFSWKTLGKAGRKAVKTTATHAFARATASFREYWVLDLELPACFCSLVLELMDDDGFSGPVHIYGAKRVPLDPFIQEAYRADSIGNVLPGKLMHEVIFDTFPKDHEVVAEGCICKRRVKEPKPAVLSLEIEVLTQEDAHKEENAKIVDGFKDAKPKGQVAWQAMIFRPTEFVAILLGPRNLLKLRVCCGGSVCCLLLMVFLCVLYLMIQIFVVPFK